MQSLDKNRLKTEGLKGYYLSSVISPKEQIFVTVVCILT